MKLCLPLLLLLGVCSLGKTEEASTVPSSPDAITSGGKDEMERKEENGGCGGAQQFSPEARQVVGGAIERLGLQLLQKLSIGSQQPNVIISPLSVSLALAQLALGARNETERLLLSSLHANSEPCYHHILGGLLQHLNNTFLDVATRMYLRPGFDVRVSFVDDSLARYGSVPAPLVSVEEVNQWVENATEGHIANFLESLPHDIVLMLINAVYFKGEWQTRFDPQVTSKGAFYLDVQKAVSVDMMKSAHYPLRLMDDAELQAQVASFPFKGNTSFLVVMPLLGRANVSSVLPKLNISDLYRRLPQETTMQVNLPKFKLQYRQELQESLTSMGLGSLFSGPDLSGISDHPLKVTAVRHASGIELCEKGVEASATTVVTTMRSISLFSINSPFIFALVDEASLTPFFLGVVTNPAPDDDPMPSDDPHGNRTQSDEPVKHNDGEIDMNNKQSRGAIGDSDTHSDAELTADSSVQPCGAPADGKELQQSLNGPGQPGEGDC
ncbi:alpha-2-antiplasmin [Lampris incognitus]|uniref:alpha-2-antiplasmin n=1 Tax=Lampris incognitus TaxID=2546036 RepID=UPI0024B544B0|nr:alpha-2-antiplasmin [Lampris incognitus]